MLMLCIYFANLGSLWLKLLETWYFVLNDTLASISATWVCEKSSTLQILLYLTEEYWMAKTRSWSVISSADVSVSFTGFFFEKE